VYAHISAVQGSLVVYVGPFFQSMSGVGISDTVSDPHVFSVNPHFVLAQDATSVSMHAHLSVLCECMRAFPFRPLHVSGAHAWAFACMRLSKKEYSQEMAGTTQSYKFRLIEPTKDTPDCTRNPLPHQAM
jgi:hypothetical protein